MALVDHGFYETIIVGGGFSGVGMAIELLKAGRKNFVVLEKAAQYGGTWRENTYPGCACDVPSVLYSYSFEQDWDWEHPFAKQPQIAAYMRAVAKKHGVERYTRFNSDVDSAVWHESHGLWEVRSGNDLLWARTLVAAQGPLHEPRVPDIPGLGTFTGEMFHSATWNHNVSLAGKKVVVLGTGSSAIQFVPEIQPVAGSLTVFQRTAPWVLPRGNPELPRALRALSRLKPLRNALREGVYAGTELIQLAQRRPRVMRALAALGRAHLRRQVADSALRERLTPSFALGCKRMLFSNTWYPALQADNARVVHSGAVRVSGNRVFDADGNAHEADVLILATGFHVTDASLPSRVQGRLGTTLAEEWQGSPEAYLGTNVHGFPNLFLMLGPNLGNGHGSAFVIIEAQTRYVVDAIEQMDEQSVVSVDVRPVPQARFNERVQRALQGSVWNDGGCRSWYIDANGRNSAIYPWTTIDLRRRLAAFDLGSFSIVRAAIPDQSGWGANPRATERGVESAG